MGADDASMYQRGCEGRGGTSKVNNSLHMDQKPAFRLYTLGSLGWSKLR